MQTSSGPDGRFAVRMLLLSALLVAAGTQTLSSAAQERDPAPAIISLCLITFDPSLKPPPRISAQGKACLDDVTLNLQKRPETKIALIGNVKTSERSGALLAARRAAVVKKYLVREKGVDVTRVVLYTGHQDAAVVAIELLPPGKSADTKLLVPVNEAKLR